MIILFSLLILGWIIYRIEVKLWGWDMNDFKYYIVWRIIRMKYYRWSWRVSKAIKQHEKQLRTDWKWDIRRRDFAKELGSLPVIAFKAGLSLADFSSALEILQQKIKDEQQINEIISNLPEGSKLDWDIVRQARNKRKT